MLEGWTDLTPQFLDSHRAPLNAEELVRFYDGQEPGWQHAQAGDEIPRRQVVPDTLVALRDPAVPTQVLLVADAGQGKSTALRQIAVDLVRSGHKVLFREPGAALDPSAVAALPARGVGLMWILVSDDAEEIANDAEKAIEHLFAVDRNDIHWVLSARTVDWKARFLRYGRSLEPAWDRFGKLWPALGDRDKTMALSAPEADKLLGLWAAVGCLGALEEVAEADRAEVLLTASTTKKGLSDATLLGAVVETRFGADGLPAHLEDALAKIDDHLRRAFLSAAAAQVAGVDGVDLYVLADLIGVDRARRRQDILVPLGQAGLATGSCGALRARHPAMARAAIASVEAGRIDGDLEDIFRQLVRATGVTGSDVKTLAVGGAIMNSGPLLAEKLQQIGIAAGQSHRLACAVADEAEAGLGDFLLFTVARARTYREAGKPLEARDILRSLIAGAPAKKDWDLVGRTYLHELSVSEAAVERPAESIVLAGMSLADAAGLDRVTMADAKLALLALGTACGHVDDLEHEVVFQRLLRAGSHLGQKVTPKWDQRARFDLHTFDVRADEFDIPFTSAAESVVWLDQAFSVALDRLEDAEIRAFAERLLPDVGHRTYSELEKTIGLGRLPWALE